MIDYGKHNVLGVSIDAVDYDAIVEQIVGAAKSGRPLSVSALAVHGVMTGVLDPVHRHRLNGFDLLVPDGQPVRWALRLLHGVPLPDRVYGPRLMLKTCARAATEKLPVFLYGSRAAVLDRLSAKLMHRYPNLEIAGAAPSRFRRLSSSERDQTIETIRASGAAITFVGLGCPRQEIWTYEFHEALAMPTLAVGAAFDFHAGTVPQAPQSLQNWGLEWLFRLQQEPSRLWKRYLLLNPLYLSLLVLQWTQLRRFPYENNQRPAEPLLYG